MEDADNIDKGDAGRSGEQSEGGIPDAEVAALVAAWPTLPEPIKAAIRALLGSVMQLGTSTNMAQNPRNTPTDLVTQSLIERLTDDDAKQPGTRREAVALLKRSVRRDLEWLLNTRRTPETAPDSLELLQRSLYHYGLPDTSSMSRDSPEVRNRLARLVEQAISAHEPRLAGVRVELAGGEKTAIGAVRFVIEAMLRMDPSPERVSFDTLLSTGAGSVVVVGGGNA